MIELSYNKKDLNEYLRLSLKWWSIWTCAKEKPDEKTPDIYFCNCFVYRITKTGSEAVINGILKYG